MPDNQKEAKLPPAFEHELGSETTGEWSNPKYSFVWTDKHLSRVLTNPLRQQYDELGAKTLEALQNIIKSKQAKDREHAPKLDLFAILRDNHQTDPVLSAFWKEVNTVPEWVDWERIKRGQPFLYRYGAANLVGFGLQGFFGENSGVNGVTEVLARTGGFKTPVLLRRLTETFSWLLQVTDNLPSVQPGGDAWVSTVRVRLLHASVRQRILKLVDIRPSYFDVQEFGIPANTLDSIHSITTFACNPPFLQLPQMGILPSQQETDDYIALFRYLSYVLGAPEQYVATTEQARATMESMLVHELHKPSQTSKDIGSNLMAAIEDLPPLKVSRHFMEAGARSLNGDVFCDALDLGKPRWTSYAAWHMFCLVVSILAIVQRAVPLFDRYMVKTFHDLLHDIIIHGKHGLKGSYKFQFQYVPQVDDVKVVREGSCRVLKAGLIERPLETALVVMFLVFYCGLLAILYCCISAFGSFTSSTE